MRLSIAGWMLVLAWCGGVAAPGASAQKAATKGKPMTSAEFDRLIHAKDWSAVDVAREGGPGLVHFLETYLRNPDYQIRLLAVDCIAAAGGPQAPPALIRMLADSNEQVRINSINGLHKNLPFGHEADLMAAFDANNTRDAFVRQQIPMIFGRMQATSWIGQMRARFGGDARQEVKDGVIAGTAKLGDADAQRAFGKLLRDARGARTAALIEFVKYIDQPWLIPMLVPVLQRKDLAIDLSTHRHEFKRRECDLAVDEIVRLSGARFSFAVDPMGQYTDAQIAEVQRFAEGR